MIQDIPLRYIKGVGPRKEKAFNELGMFNMKDLVYYFPFRYEDRRLFKKIKDLKIDEFVLVKGIVRTVNLKKMPYFAQSRKVKSIFEIVLEDETGNIKCNWFNQGYLFEIIKPGLEVIIYGKSSIFNKGLQMTSPDYALSNNAKSLHAGKIVGVYRLSSEFSQKFIRKTILSALEVFHKDCLDPLPFNIRKKRNMPNIVKSLEDIHLPLTWKDAEKARERFIFEELFFSQILVYLRKAKHLQQKGIVLNIDKKEINRIEKKLVFELTSFQKEVLSQILSDLSRSYPMHRLLQGDVGCGKTVVAAFALGICAKNGCQAALMVPTEVLAHQHKESLQNILCGAGGLTKNSVRVITSSISKKDVQLIYKDLEEGKIKIIIGTHSLIQNNIKFKNLGLVVIDEQHKFGVAQRALLYKKGKIYPHCLVMSATPIPRSLALSLYGDLDISVIKESPKGRIPAKTMWLKDKQREWVYNFVEGMLNKGRQVYIIYPVIEENQDEELKSLKLMYGEISKRFLSFSVGMFHGKMKGQEKIKTIEKFKEKKIDVLVSTTVVEVGVDIENATTMIVENPERFGLAQLHQLRGRIQRSTYQPYFILISKDNLSDHSLSRLEIISKTCDGFIIAEEDLKLRGPGDFFGKMQHGLPDLRIANPLRDLELLKEARIIAYKTIKEDPKLLKIQNKDIKLYVDAYFKGNWVKS
ncbi:MAG: ATP-dependent DNA helicase RecG [Candidatus Omnitrophica bacterium]|nr:ATP-dependent DNA helicase RecG [Candidatus Omnitrophota bacterium]